MQAAGTQPWDSDKKVTPIMQGLLADYGDRYPALTAATASANGSAAHDNGRAFGLERILDGLESLIAQRAGSPPAP
jgi:hypothetical protein